MGDSVWVALISAGVTILTAVQQSRVNKRDQAKQSIITWIMHDKLEYLMDKELPKHYEKIHAEYEVYHKNGGNGIITAEVEQYDKWLKKVELKLIDAKEDK